MRMLDFLFYYLTLWFTQNKQKLIWSTPLQRAAYAITIVTIFWILTIWETLVFVLPLFKNFNITAIPLTITGICVLLFYQYIYINRNRYELITSPNYRKFKISDKNGILISIIFGLTSAIIPFVLAVIFSL
jgi:hypothetical protein